MIIAVEAIKPILHGIMENHLYRNGEGLFPRDQLIEVLNQMVIPGGSTEITTRLNLPAFYQRFDVKELYQTLVSIQRGKVDTIDFASVFPPGKVGIDVERIIEQKKLAIELDKILAAFKADRRWVRQAFEFIKECGHIHKTATKLAETNSGFKIAIIIWAKYNVRLPLPMKLQSPGVADGLSPINYSMEGSRQIAKVNRRVLQDFVKYGRRP